MPITKTVSDSALAWKSFTDKLCEVGLRIHADADRLRSARQHGEINQAMLWSLSMGALYLAQMDPDHPDWLPHLNSAFLNVCASPDVAYYLTRVRGQGVYRITGKRGTVARIDLAIQKGFIGFTDHSPTLRNINIDDLNISPDETFELLLGGERPAGFKGNWFALDPATDDIFLLVRQISYDRSTEEDGYLTIQRVDTPIGQDLRYKDIDRRLAEVPSYVEKMASTIMALMATQFPADHQINRVENITKKFGEQSSIIGQTYYAGELVLGPDEALIIEFEPPENCPYWNTQLVDSFFNALDYLFHQTELNSERVHVDPDGKVRIVVSQKDPGVPNWMDKGDYERNVIRFRWYKGATPELRSRTVAVSEVAKFLPPSTPRVTPEERQAELRRRVEGVQRRRRW